MWCSFSLRELPASAEGPRRPLSPSVTEVGCPVRPPDGRRPRVAVDTEVDEDPEGIDYEFGSDRVPQLLGRDPKPPGVRERRHRGLEERERARVATVAPPRERVVDVRLVRIEPGGLHLRRADLTVYVGSEPLLSVLLLEGLLPVGAGELEDAPRVCPGS